MSVSFEDASGQRVEVNLQEHGTMHMYRMSNAATLTPRQWINRQYPTAEGKPDAFQQFCVSAGIRFRRDENLGTPAANLQDILNPLAATNQTGGSATTFPQVPDSRLLFPAAIMEAVNAALDTKENEAVAAFDGLVAYTDYIASDRWEQPVISVNGKKGPEDSAFRRIAQLAPPALMLAITAADYTRTIPTEGIGLTISQKALQNNSLDLVARTLTHFYKKANYAKWVANFGLILSGDADATNVPMATAKSALAQVKADVYDATIAANGTLTQDAWINYLYHNQMSMTKTHLVTDLAGALAIDKRTNRPTNVQNNSTDRIDTPIQVVYPNLNGKPVQVVVMPPDTWSANTIMGLDKTSAIGRVVSTTADYSAIEDVVMLRAMNMIVTRGELLYRLYDDAFDVLSLTYTS